jgi:hypothetical protein
MSVSTKASTNTPDEELVNALDEVIELVLHHYLTPLPDHEDIQLLPDSYNKSLDQATIDQTEKMDIDKDLGTTEPTYPYYTKLLIIQISACLSDLKG